MKNLLSFTFVIKYIVLITYIDKKNKTIKDILPIFIFYSND